MGKIKEETKRSIEFWLAIFLVIIGVVLLFLGFYAVPIGEISASVLTAYGETATFAGSILGIDYNYRFKRDVLEMENKRERRKSDGTDIGEEVEAE